MLATIPLVYIFSFLFVNPFTARIVTLIVAFIGGPVLPITSYFLKLAGGKTAEVNSDLIPLYRIFPGYSLGDGLLQMASKSETTSVWDKNVTGTNIATLYWTAVVYLLTLIAIEYLISVPKFSLFIRRLFRLERDIDDSVNAEQFEEDSDVLKEKEGMMSGEIAGGSIQVRGLRKVYGSQASNQKLAVRDLWFNIPKGQCFGFLGINGAGK